MLSTAAEPPGPLPRTPKRRLRRLPRPREPPDPLCVVSLPLLTSPRHEANRLGYTASARKNFLEAAKMFHEMVQNAACPV